MPYLRWILDVGDSFKDRFTEKNVPCSGVGHLLTYDTADKDKEKKPTIVFIHGAVSSWWSFREQFQVLLPKYRIVAPNLRGHGGSPWKETSDIGDFYRDICEWFDNMSLDYPVILVGHSLGGYVSARYAADHPERVSRLVLISTCGSFERGVVCTFLETCWQSADLVRSIFPWLVKIDSYMAGCLTKVVFPQWDCWDSYPKIKASTLVIIGAFDPLFSLKQGKRVAELIPKAHFNVVECGGHNPQLDHGEEVAALIEEFLDKSP